MKPYVVFHSGEPRTLFLTQDGWTKRRLSTAFDLKGHAGGARLPLDERSGGERPAALSYGGDEFSEVVCEAGGLRSPGLGVLHRVGDIAYVIEVIEILGVRRHELTDHSAIGGPIGRPLDPIEIRVVQIRAERFEACVFPACAHAGDQHAESSDQNQRFMVDGALQGQSVVQSR